MPSFSRTSRHALLTTEEMARADAATIEAGTPGESLMENAGRAVAEEAMARRRSPGRAVVLAGPGNNGGDGFVAARYLAEAGWTVTVALLGSREKRKGDAATMAQRWPGPVTAMAPDALAGAELVIDAVFGAGLTRAVEGAAAETIAAANALEGALRVAVDIPSGVSGDDGQLKGTAFAADCTVTFFCKKPGHLLAPGRFSCGEVRVRDIGITSHALERIGPRDFENEPPVWAGDWPERDPMDHKYRRGHALVVSGRPPMLGASRLTAMAALRAGAGLVSLAVAEEGYAIQASALTEVMVAPFADAAGFSALLADPRRNVVAIGPGAGADAATRNRVLAVLEAGKDAVLDADALTAFEAAPETLFEAVAAAQGAVVMTPHSGEFARLFGDPGAPDKLTATRRAAARSSAVVLHKGPDSVIAAPESTALIDAQALPSLATAGSGDVLTGILAGLMAQGMAPVSAAGAGVWLHAAAARCGPARGLIAGDLVDALPRALDRLAGALSGEDAGSH